MKIPSKLSINSYFSTLLQNHVLQKINMLRFYYYIILFIRKNILKEIIVSGDFIWIIVIFHFGQKVGGSKSSTINDIYQFYLQTVSNTFFIISRIGLDLFSKYIVVVTEIQSSSFENCYVNYFSLTSTLTLINYFRL